MNPKIIAEVASNHAGDISLAKQFIRSAKTAGADYVKFQSSRFADLADKNDFQAEWVRKTELSDEAHFELIDECKKQDIKFLTTCFSSKRVKFLASLGIEEIKVASPDLLSFGMIEKLAGSFRYLIISTGMHNIAEIKRAIDFLRKNKINATLLHAVSIYPTPIDKVFMYKFLWLRDNFPKAGYSNHTPELEALSFAVNNGASVVEAHIKLSNDGPGRVTPWDILPQDFRKIKQLKYNNITEKMLGSKEWLKDENFLFPEEIAARKKFIGRWGRNDE